MLVVNDAALATAINRLRGEWTERQGGQLAAESKRWAETASAEAIAADVIVFPARYLGELAERIRPVRENIATGKLYDADDVLPLVRNKLGMYGGRLLALPIGVQLPLVGYRGEWLAPNGAMPPSTWQQYHELVSRVGAAPRLWPAPNSVDHWPAIMLLARAAAYACHPRQESALFDPQTMEPQIAGPPFVKALDEWQQELSNAPERGNAASDADRPTADTVRWAEMPGAEQVFNRSTGQWESTPSAPRRVPLLAGGIMVAVTTASRNAATAFELNAWLASSEIASQLVPSETALLPCRRSHLLMAGQWLERSLGHGGNSKISDVLETALSRDDCLVVPRIPGVDDYLSELANAVDMALTGDRPSTDALKHAAQKWNLITGRLGRDTQRRAYLKHLGLTTP